MENEINNTPMNDANETNNTTMNNTQQPVYTGKPYKKSNKGLVVFLIILIIALLGALGYFVYDKYIKNNVVEEPNTNEPTKVTPTLNYDQSKTVIINGKEHLIGYVRGSVNEGIYIKNTIELYFDNVKVSGNYMINSDNEIKTQVFKGTNAEGNVSEYAIVSFRNEDTYHNYIFNDNGEVLSDIIGTANIGYIVNSDNKTYWTYDLIIKQNAKQINNVKIDVIEQHDATYVNSQTCENYVLKNIYVINGKVETENVKTYVTSELSSSGLCDI